MIAWLAGNMVWATFAMLLVLALRRPVAHLFGAGPAYALWLLPALRLVAPPLPEAAAGSLLPSLDLVVLAGGAAAASTPPDAAAAWLPALLLPWAAGAAGFLAWQWLAYRAFLTRLSLSSRSLGSHAGLPLVESAAVPGPIALGLLDRRIVVPADFTARYSPAEQRLALDHEHVHHRRGDLWWNGAALLVLALSWFNPVAWLASRAFREDQELACDAAVASRAAAAERHDYASALVKSASRPGLIAVCPLNHADQLKRRLKMMKHHRISALRTLGGGGAVALLSGLALTLGSAGVAHPHADGEEGERRQHRIVVLEKGGSGTEVGERQVRQFRLRRGENGEIDLPEGCRDGGEVFNHSTEDGDRRNRFIICASGEATSVDRLEMLESARRRLGESDHLSDEQRARVTAALDREIARLRDQ